MKPERVAAWSLLASHAVLFFGWGLALNNIARGYLYCRLVVPVHYVNSGWVFSLVGVAVFGSLHVYGHHRRRSLWSGTLAPLLLFVTIQGYAFHLIAVNSRDLGPLFPYLIMATVLVVLAAMHDKRRANPRVERSSSED